LRQLQSALLQGDEKGMRQACIVQSPMGLRLESQAELVHQVLQTVTPGMGHENARQGKSVNAGIGA